jgi:hypothetical protein
VVEANPKVGLSIEENDCFGKSLAQRDRSFTKVTTESFCSAFEPLPHWFNAPYKVKIPTLSRPTPAGQGWGNRFIS